MGFFDAFVPKVATAAKAEAPVDIEAALAPYDRDNGYFFSGVFPAERLEAVSVPTIARGLDILQTIGSLPLKVRNVATGERIIAPRVLNQPDPRIPGSVFWAQIVRDLCLYPAGYSYVMERYADTGRIRSMERIDPTRVSVKTNDKGTEVEAYMIDSVYVDPNNLVVFPGGMALLARAGRTIKAAVALEKAALDFANDPVPQIVLKSNGTSLPADRISKLLNAFRNRQKKSVVYLNADVNLENIGFDPKNLQLNEARNYVSLELARAIGIPAYFVDAQQSTFTYSNALDKRRDLVDFAFRNYMTQLEQRLSFADFVPAGQEVKFDVDDFLRGNPYERAQVYEILNRIGAMSIEEIREEEDLIA
jgi:HK97 family phage portal protein